MKKQTWKMIAASLIGFAALQLTATAQCPRPDRLDGGPCCAIAQPDIPKPKAFRQDSLQICWRDCDVDQVIDCFAEWSIGSTNQSPCAIRRMQLKLRDAAGAIKWRGRMNVQYSRTWLEVDPTGVPTQVWRYLANGDLRPTANTGPSPCPVPPCATQFNGRVRYTGYIDMAIPCQTVPGTVSNRSFSWMLTHACDQIDHNPAFPRGGSFHPDRSYSFVGPAAGFIPTALQPIEIGTSSLDAIRRVDLSTSTPMCQFEEQIDFGIQPLQEFCLCSGPVPGSQQWVVSDFVLGGACGTSIASGGQFLPGFFSMAIGTWTDPTTYPGVEGLRWNYAGNDYVDPCVGLQRSEAFYGVTTLRGNPAFTIPSIAGTASVPLPLTFIDQCNALRSGNTVMNVPWKKSDHFLNLNLP
ncbi:MAG: hypothetical protein ACI8QZ_000790 [Chlamydiales bacterium]|jgi:hypothetical protein